MSQNTGRSRFATRAQRAASPVPAAAGVGAFFAESACQRANRPSMWPAMRQISLDVLSIALEVPFAPPRTKRQAALDELATWLCTKEKGLGLRSDQVRLKSWDDLFAYEMQAQFFGENGLIVVTADKIRLEVKNARTAADWELVRQLIVRFYLHLKFPADSVTTFSAYVHSQLSSAEDVDAYFQQRTLPQLST